MSYVQNSEQDTNTLWSRIHGNSLKPIDLLYKEYRTDNFANLVVDRDAEPELYDFIESSKLKARFNNYETSKIEYFAKRIYELRKYNTNNTP